MSGLSSKFVNTSIPRDRNKRPLVVAPKDERPDLPADERKRTAYRRVTKFISVIEDRYLIELYQQRLVAWGMGQRPDLQALSASTSLERKAQLNDIARQAKEYAKENAKSNEGTARHQFCEQIDLGQTLGHVPADMRADLDAYRKATAHLKMVEVESFRVFDDWKVGGTCDRVIYDPVADRYYIADIKTGTIDFNGEMAMQFAMYARSRKYDVATDTRVDPGYHVDVTKALIIHLPAGEGRCELKWIDIQKGWAACQQAKRVWDTRDLLKSKDLMWDYVPEANNGVVIPSAEQYLAMVPLAKSVDELTELWRAAKWSGSDTKDFVQACAERKAEILALAS